MSQSYRSKKTRTRKEAHEMSLIEKESAVEKMPMGENRRRGDMTMEEIFEGFAEMARALDELGLNTKEHNRAAVREARNALQGRR